MNIQDFNKISFFYLNTQVRFFLAPTSQDLIVAASGDQLTASPLKSFTFLEYNLYDANYCTLEVNENSLSQPKGQGYLLTSSR